EIRAIRAATDCELEIFVHGALCVAYSGQCFSSEAWGGRSANRGQCAQACRLPYELIVDGAPRPLGDARYLLSPGDLYALVQIPEILPIGIAALKIEGRYKDAGYVALATRAYRQAVDDAWAGRAASITPAEELQLQQVYSRGLGPFFLSGTNHQAVVRGRAPRHRGVEIGRVARVLPASVLIEPGEAHAISPLKPGDGLVFDAADWRSPEEPEEGGRVYEVVPARGGKLEVRFANGAIHFGRIRTGDLVWRTHDPDLDKAVRPYTEAAAPVRKQPLRVRVTAREGAPLAAVWSLRNRPEIQVTVASAAPLGPARNRAISLDLLREQFGRLGNTPYVLESVDLNVEGAPFAPGSILNQIRRQAVEQLAERQGQAPAIELREPAAVLAAALAAVVPDPAPSAELPAELHLLVRTPEQLDAALDARPASITLDYLDLYGLRPSIERVRSVGLTARVAGPRVLKPGEERIADFLLKLDCPIVVRAGGLLETLRRRPHPALIGDFSLNAANSLTAGLLLALDLERITPTHDLNADQIATLAREVGAEKIEAVAYQHLPVFHTEHCVFCRFLSTGTSYRDCGRPCDHHRVAVRDLQGRSHPVIADVGCRNTVFGSEAQEAAAHLDSWRRAGIRHFRLEFAHESAEQVARVARAFASTLAGERTPAQLAQDLRKLAPEGTTAGSLHVPPNYLSLPVL
ncbi:MAG TPA: DUF3656 domain-containing protein, partial [Bryobacteraceae bacterium]|nr:DUF3656 domain-containing protein [Bryobacteraceae bacterium]